MLGLPRCENLWRFLFVFYLCCVARSCNIVSVPFVFFVLRHSRVWQVFTPRWSPNTAIRLEDWSVLISENSAKLHLKRSKYRFKGKATPLLLYVRVISRFLLFCIYLCKYVYAFSFENACLFFAGFSPSVHMLTIKNALKTAIFKNAVQSGDFRKRRFIVYVFATSALSIMHFFYPQKFCINIVFNFSWDDCKSHDKLKMQNFGG